MLFPLIRFHGLNVVEVETTDTGFDLEELKKQIEKQPIRFIYTIPTFQNPTGTTMPQQNREELLSLCERHHIILIEDSIRITSYNVCYTKLLRANEYPKLVEELVPNLLSLGVVMRVLQNLLREGVSVRDIRTILETLADWAPVVQDPDQLTEHVRAVLARSISRITSYNVCYTKLLRFRR